MKEKELYQYGYLKEKKQIIMTLERFKENHDKLCEGKITLDEYVGTQYPYAIEETLYFLKQIKKD